MWPYDKSGSLALPITEVWLPGASSLSIRAATADSNHRLVLSVLWWTQSGEMLTSLCFLTPRGLVDVVPTQQFVAEQLQFSEDGGLWAFGYRPGASASDFTPFYKVLHRFSADANS